MSVLNMEEVEVIARPYGDGVYVSVVVWLYGYRLRLYVQTEYKCMVTMVTVKRLWLNNWYLECNYNQNP